MCDVDFDEHASVWSNAPTKARKQHECTCCSGTIKPGDVYIRHFSVFDEDVFSEKVCPFCVITIEKYEREHKMSWTPSYMKQALTDCIDYERYEDNEEMVELWQHELAAMEERSNATK